jgi:hypothetical protein
LFKIDYEVNLTRKYILFHNIPYKTIDKSNDQNKATKNVGITTNNTVKNTITNNTTINPTTSNYYSENYISNQEYTNLNKIMLSKLNSVKTIIISNPINQVENINNNNYKTYTNDFENLDNAIKSTFLNNSFKIIVTDKSFKLTSSNLNQEITKIREYLINKEIDGCIVPLVKKYYYYEKEGNTLIPTVEIKINYLLLNQKGEIIFFNTQEIQRNIAVISSGSERYRKSKLIDLSIMSVQRFIKDYEEYIENLKNVN